MALGLRRGGGRGGGDAESKAAGRADGRVVSLTVSPPPPTPSLRHRLSSVDAAAACDTPAHPLSLWSAANRRWDRVTRHHCSRPRQTSAARTHSTAAATSKVRPASRAAHRLASIPGTVNTIPTPRHSCESFTVTPLLILLVDASGAAGQRQWRDLSSPYTSAGSPAGPRRRSASGRSAAGRADRRLQRTGARTLRSPRRPMHSWPDDGGRRLRGFGKHRVRGLTAARPPLGRYRLWRRSWSAAPVRRSGTASDRAADMASDNVRRTESGARGIDDPGARHAPSESRCAADRRANSETHT